MCKLGRGLGLWMAAVCGIVIGCAGDRSTRGGSTSAPVVVTDEAGTDVPSSDRLLTVLVRVQENGARILDVIRGPDRRNSVRGTVPRRGYRLDLLDAAGVTLASETFDATMEARGTFEGPDGTEHVRVPTEFADAAVRITDVPGGAVLRVVRMLDDGEVVLVAAPLPPP